MNSKLDPNWPRAEQVTLTREQSNDAYQALTLWANWIEIGNLHLSAGDVRERNARPGPSASVPDAHKVKKLSPEQVQRVAELRKLASHFLAHSTPSTRDLPEASWG